MIEKRIGLDRRGALVYCPTPTALKRTTNIDVDAMSFRIVELGSDEVFNYPFAYVSEPGEMEPAAHCNYHRPPGELCSTVYAITSTTSAANNG